MLNRPRKYAHPEDRPNTRMLRGNKWFWCDKEVTRFFRKNFPKRHYNNLRSIYLALCEMDSDFLEGNPIRGFKKTLCTYSGRSFDIVTKYFYFLEQLELVTAHQVRDDKGHFSETFLYLSEIEDQMDDYYADPEWFNSILDTEESILGKGYNMLKITDNKTRLTCFPVNRENGKPSNPHHKKICDDKNKSIDKNNYTSRVNPMEVDVPDSDHETQVEQPQHSTQVLKAIPAEILVSENQPSSIPIIYPVSSNTTITNTPSKTKAPVILTRKQLCYKERADRLVEIIESHTKIRKNSAVHTWPKVIEKIHRLDGVELKRIDAVLDWYADNIGGEYVPEAFSAQTFREKFVRFEQAIKRQNREGKTSREAQVARQNKEIGEDFELGVTDAYKGKTIRKNKQIVYFTKEEPDVEKIITYDMAIDMIKRGEQPHPYVADFYNKVKEQEGL